MMEVDADELEYHVPGKISRASGNVRIRYRGMFLTSLRASFDHARNELIAEGNVTFSRGDIVVHCQRFHHLVDEDRVEVSGKVEVISGDIRLVCERAIFDVEKQELISEDKGILYHKGLAIACTRVRFHEVEGKVKLTDVAFYREPWYVKGKRLLSFPDDRFELKQGSFTTCDLPHPHYRIDARRVEMVTDKYLTGHHAILRLGDFPIFYFPRFRRSLRKVPEGLVIYPYYSSQAGMSVTAHYNWYVSEKFRGRWYLDYHGRLGWGKGFDVRYQIPRDQALGSGYLYGYHIDERRNPRGKEPPRSRWKVHYRHRENLAQYVQGIVRADVFADPDFNEDYLDQEHWRGWSRDELEDQDPEGSFSLTRSTPDHTLRLYSRVRVNSFTDITEEVPRLSFDLKEKPWGESDLYYKWKNELSYLRESPGEERTAQAWSGFGLSYPRRIRWLSVTPSAEQRGFWYSDDQEGNHLALLSNRLGLDLRTTYGIWKMWERPEDPSWTKLRHTIDPRLRFTYVPEPSGHEEKLLDIAKEPWGKRKRIRLEIISLLEGVPAGGEQVLRPLEREEEQAGEDEAGDLWEAKEDQAEPRRIIDFTLGTYYDWPKTREEDEGVWGNVEADLRFYARPDLTFRLEASYDPNIEILEGFDTDLKYSRETWSAQVGTRFSEPDGEEDIFDFVSEFETQLGPKWGLTVKSRYDLNRSRLHDYDIMIHRDLHCWEASLLWQQRREEEDDEEETEYIIALVLAIKGLPARIPVPVRSR